MITTDASLSGWGMVFEGRPAYGVWSGKYPHLAPKWPGVESSSSSSHSLSSVPDAFTCHRQDGQHGGGVSHQSPGRLPVMHPEQATYVRQLLLWAQAKILSLIAVHVPGVLNLAAYFLSRQKLSSGDC